MYKSFAVISYCILIARITTNNLSAQGCSDAGICTINAAKPQTKDEPVYNNQLKLGISGGFADYEISILSTYFEYNRKLSKKLSADLRLNTLTQKGNGITTTGLSDLYITLNYKLRNKFGFTGGIKIPMNKADRSQNAFPLPMDYQSSLGTTDLLFGVWGQIQKLQLVAAFQQPVTQNENRFINSEYPMPSVFNTIQSTNKFVRSSDIVIRLSYPFQILKRLKFTPSILPIYHLFEDKYSDENMIKRNIKGSDGLTLNINGFADYYLSNKSALQFNIGFPVIVRESRPDGLTRSIISTFEYRYSF